MTPAKNKLNVHHIGGRFGNGGFPILPMFERDMVRVYYDADRDCIEQVRELHADAEAEVRVLPYCVGGENAKGTLHINYDTSSSSLYPLNPEYAPYYFFSYNHDFLASDSMRTVERREVDVVSLDHVVSSGATEFAPPDFLSLDVQGAEYAILTGAAKTLGANVLGLVIETGFHPVYQGQRLFGDVHALLDKAGFHFVQFLRFQDYTPFRAYIGMRGKGFHKQADALFLRKVGDLERTVADQEVRRTMLRKLAFIALVYDQTEYALDCLRHCGTNAGTGRPASTSRYETFLDDIECSAAKMPKRFPRLFSEKYSFEVSKRRFASSASLALDAGSMGLGERIWLRFVYPRIYRIADVYRFVIERLWGAAASRMLPSSFVERTLKKYGLKEQARLLKKNRVIQTLFC